MTFNQQDIAGGIRVDETVLNIDDFQAYARENELTTKYATIGWNCLAKLYDCRHNQPFWNGFRWYNATDYDYVSLEYLRGTELVEIDGWPQKIHQNLGDLTLSSLSGFVDYIRSQHIQEGDRIVTKLLGKQGGVTVLDTFQGIVKAYQ